jgi:hypothetical protein
MLRREVLLRHPIGSSQRRRWEAVHWTCSSAFLVSMLVAAQRRTVIACGESADDTARLEVKRYLDEAYPLWRRQHPEQECPRSLVELNEYTTKGRSIADPWGMHYAFYCDDGRAHVASSGADRTFLTEDDFAAESGSDR